MTAAPSPSPLRVTHNVRTCYVLPPASTSCFSSHVPDTRTIRIPADAFPLSFFFFFFSFCLFTSARKHSLAPRHYYHFATWRALTFLFSLFDSFSWLEYSHQSLHHVKGRVLESSRAGSVGFEEGLLQGGCAAKSRTPRAHTHRHRHRRNPRLFPELAVQALVVGKPRGVQKNTDSSKRMSV